MRRRAVGLLAAALMACATSTGRDRGAPLLWTAPEAPPDPASLRIEPGPAVVATLGQDVALRLRGSAAADAHCLWAEDGHGSVRLRVRSPGRAAAIEVRCRSGVHTASAQVTFTESATRPFADPYAGALVLVKLRKAPKDARDPRSRRKLGLRSTDALLEQLGAYALPAFPFDRSGTRDPVELARWIALYVPRGVNVYQAIALLRDDPQVLRESVLPVAVPAAPADSTPLGVVGRRDTGMARVPMRARRGHVPGFGIGIAVVGEGIDGDDEAIAHRVRSKPWESDQNDADGNGLPGDRMGADFARLVVDTSHPVPRLALAAAYARPGRGDAVLARIALDAAPGAWLLPVRVGDSTWSRALGLVYAAVEGARVLACDWPEQPASWLLHDALVFAEANCALAVCARDSLPADWQEPGAGTLVDAWSGERHADFFLRPLPAGSPDPHPGPAAARAAIALARRPDLDPYTLADVLSQDDPNAAALDQPRGFCSDDASGRAREDPPWWRRTGVKVGHERRAPGASFPPPPASAEEIEP